MSWRVVGAVPPGERRGDWIATYSGGKFWPLDPRPEDVRLEDIAHALSLICRYTGHVQRFYSVAEHSIIVSQLVPPQYALHGLLHDAAEAYVTDVPSPLKRSHEFAVYRTIEDRVQRAIFARFGLDPEIPEPVHKIDKLLQPSEATQLFRDEPEWVLGRLSIDAPIVPLDPVSAERLFLDRFNELRGTR